MMILWISCMFLGSLCAAQNNIFSQATAGGSPFSIGTSSAAGSQFNQFPSTRVSASSSAGPSGASASAQVNTPQLPQPYPACLASNPDDAVLSSAPVAYSLLESSFTNPFLRAFYNTSFDTSGFYDAVYDQVKETLSKGRSQIVAGSLSLFLENALPRITPLLNAVALTNALSGIHGEEAIVIADEKEEYIEPFLTSISKAVSGSDGSADDQARAVVSGILTYLDQVNMMTYSKFNEFISLLAGEYRFVIYSTCKPSSFEVIPKP